MNSVYPAPGRDHSILNETAGASIFILTPCQFSDFKGNIVFFPFFLKILCFCFFINYPNF